MKVFFLTRIRDVIHDTRTCTTQRCKNLLGVRHTTPQGTIASHGLQSAVELRTLVH